MLGGIALAVAVVALLVNVVTPGPVGPTGAQGQPGATGPRGPNGNGTVLVYNAVNRAGFARFSSSCNHVTGDEVTIAVPGPGTIVVVAYAFGVNIGHVNTSWDVAILNLGNTPSVCASLSELHAQVEVHTDLPPSYYYLDATLSTAFTVTVGGTYTYYLNEYMYGGGNNDDYLDPGVLMAVFYPA